MTRLLGQANTSILASHACEHAQCRLRALELHLQTLTSGPKNRAGDGRDLQTWAVSSDAGATRREKMVDDFGPVTSSQSMREEEVETEEETSGRIAFSQSERPMVPKHLRAPAQLPRRESASGPGAAANVVVKHSGNSTNVAETSLYEAGEDTVQISYDASFARSVPIAQVCPEHASWWNQTYLSLLSGTYHRDGLYSVAAYFLLWCSSAESRMAGRKRSRIETWSWPRAFSSHRRRWKMILVPRGRRLYRKAGW